MVIDILEKVKSSPVSFAVAKSILESRDEKTLGHEQKITINYLRQVVKLAPKHVEEVSKQLVEAVPVLRDYQIVMILDSLPKDEEELKILFMKERITLEKDQIKKILDILSKINVSEEKKKE